MKESNNLPARGDSIPSKPMRLFAQFHSPKKRAFLAAFSQCGRIGRGCNEAGIHHSSHYIWLRKDKTYAEAFEAAKQIAADYLEDEIYRREFDGYDKPVTYQGEITGHYTDYSDTLAIFALKGLRPEQYRDSAPIAAVGPVGLSSTYPAAAVNVIEREMNQMADDLARSEAKCPSDCL